MNGRVEAVHVVIPAHQEQDLIGRQLMAVSASAARAAREWPRAFTSVTVVLDGCDDGTEEIVARFPEVDVLTVDVRCVGAARARGVEHARRGTSYRSEASWVACTDADSVVPPHWLTTQLELAARGADLVLGTVEPETALLSPKVYQRWLRHHHLDEGHPHVHGANLGVRLSAYDCVGGFRPIRVGEDVDLVHRLQHVGAHVVRTSRHRVLTSARRRGRAPAGFASYLLDL
jgi:glycosyltransferase involved in cell wall biosynthesis